tara:strand:+ start:142 stop:924 length:783 start_codon:yes stop_codon:yes gene_type:complete
VKEAWISDRFSNCFNLKSGDGLTAKNMVNGQYAVFDGNGITGYHNEFNLENENIVIGRVGALCGNARYINEKIWLTDNAFRISEYKYKFDLKLLQYLLNYLDLRNYARQTAQPVISNSSLKNILICFPDSLPEQKRIVEILDEAFKAIDQAMTNIEKNIQNAEELFQSKLNEIFSQKGDVWEEKRLDDISNIINGYAFKSKDFSSNNSVKAIKITNVGVKEFVADTENNLPNNFAESYSKVKVKQGAIVIALTRTIISSG